MTSLSVQVDPQELSRVEQLLAGIPRGLEKAMAGAVNDTARKQVTQIGRKIRARVNIKQQDIKPHIRRTKASQNNPAAQITLSESERISLKRFGARQVRRGVSYKIERQGRRQTIRSAFGPAIARLGGHAYVRIGKSRLPIRQLRGPSPWGVFVGAKLEQPTAAESQQMLHEALDRRVQFLLLKASGQI